MADLVSGLQVEVDRLVANNAELAYQLELQREENRLLRGKEEANETSTPRTHDLLLQVEVLKLHKEEFLQKEAEFEEMRHSLVSLQQKLQETPAVVVNYQTRINHLQAELDHAKQELSKLAAMEARVQTTIGELTHEKALVQRRCGDLETVVAQQTMEVQTLHKRVEELAHAKYDATLVTSPDAEQQLLIKHFEDEMKELKRKLAAEGGLSTSLHLAEDANRSLRGQNEALQEERNKATASLLELQLSTRTNPMLIADLQHQVTALEEQLSSINTTAATQRALLDSTRTELTVQQERLESMQNTSAQMISEANGKADAAERAATAAQERLRKVEAGRSAAHEERDLAVLKAADVEARLSGLKDEREKGAARVRQLEGELRVLQREAETHAKEVSELRLKLSEAKAEARTATQELASVRVREVEVQTRLKKSDERQGEYDKLVLLQKTWQYERISLQEELKRMQTMEAMQYTQVHGALADHINSSPTSAKSPAPVPVPVPAPMLVAKSPIKAATPTLVSAPVPLPAADAEKEKEKEMEKEKEKTKRVKDRERKEQEEKEAKEKEREEKEREREQREKERKEKKEREKEKEAERERGREREKEVEREKERDKEREASRKVVGATSPVKKEPRSLGLPRSSANAYPATATIVANKAPLTESATEDAPVATSVPAAAGALSTASTKRARVESPSRAGGTTALERCVAFTGFKEEDQPHKNDLTQIAMRLGIAVNNSSEFDQNITHVVSPVASKTMKTLAGALTGRWLVTDRWLVDSDAANHVLHESTYGKRYLGRPFEGKKFALSVAFKAANNHVKDALDLIKLGRGIIVGDEGEADIVIVPNSWRDNAQLAANPKMRVWNAFIGMIGHDDDDERHTTAPHCSSTEVRARDKDGKDSRDSKGVHFDGPDHASPVHNSGSGSKRKKSVGSQDEGHSTNGTSGTNGKNTPRRR